MLSRYFLVWRKVPASAWPDISHYHLAQEDIRKMTINSLVLFFALGKFDTGGECQLIWQGLLKLSQAFIFHILNVSNVAL
jgi:hypothetical protein